MRSTVRLAALCAIAVLVVPAAPCRARISTDYAYSWDQVWQATVRLLRIDLGCEIRDRDAEIAYVMFDYPGAAGRTHPGSVELVRARGSDGAERVRVVVQIPSLPSYVERMVTDRLTRKLRDDFGEPIRRPRPAVPPPETGDGDGEEPPSGEPPAAPPAAP